MNSSTPIGAKDNVLLEKSFAFGVRIFKLSRLLQREQFEYVVSKQIVRSGTSVGANAEEAVGAISKTEFSSKAVSKSVYMDLETALKYPLLIRKRETSYWLRLLHAADCLPTPLFESLESDCQELCRILFSILRSSGRT